MSRSLVRGHELLRPFPHVFLLRSQGFEVQSAPFRDDNHYGYSALSGGYFICLYESQLGDDLLYIFIFFYLNVTIYLSLFYILDFVALIFVMGQIRFFEISQKKSFYFRPVLIYFLTV